MEVQSEAVEVDVGVYQAGGNAAAGQIDPLYAVAAPVQQFVTTDGQDAPVAHDHGRGDHLLRVHGVDAAVGQ